MKKPLVVINCKTYPQASGRSAVLLAKHCVFAAKKTKRQILLCCSALDLAAVAAAVKGTSVSIFAEHADVLPPGQSTGAITLEAIKAAGGKGTLLNHAEKQLDDATIERTIARCKTLKLAVILCANTPERAAALARFSPDYLAIEPPELIGGTVSVSSARPDVVRNAVALCGPAMQGKVLVGAGVHTAADVATAAKLGAAGVLLASGVVLAKDQKRALLDLLT